MNFSQVFQESSNENLQKSVNTFLSDNLTFTPISIGLTQSSSNFIAILVYSTP